MRRLSASLTSFCKVIFTLGGLITLSLSATSHADTASHSQLDAVTPTFGIPWKFNTHGIPPKKTLTLGLGQIHLLSLASSFEKPQSSMKSYITNNNDYFTELCNRLFKMNFSEIMALINVSNKDWYHRALTMLPPGTRFQYMQDAQGNLIKLKIMNDPLHGISLTRRYGPPGYHLERIIITPDTRVRIYSAIIRTNLNQAAYSAGLSKSQTLEMEKLLSERIQINREMMKGDHFKVIIQTDSLHGKLLNSQLLGVVYQGKRTALSLIHYNNDFYSPDGKALEADFERYPFSGHFNVTSPFDPKRVNPITGQVAAHNGTDFSMPVGTQITAPSDGIVTKVATDLTAGNYLVIQHEQGIETRYLHLSQVLVKQGDKVTINEPIALSGATGSVTGPHLHYEVIVNNQPEDPMIVALPHHPTLTGADLEAFKKYTASLLSKPNGHPSAQNQKSTVNTNVTADKR